MSMKKILKMMEFALFNPEKYDEAHIKKKFKEKNYNLFSLFCLGGPPEMQLAHYIGPDKLKLTQKGVREYHRLESKQSQRRFNSLMLIATSILAFIAILNLLKLIEYI
ncbi:MAG: hypothetical protein GQ477_03085 [Nanohaloarchaea archaeon]|nr:hypothetical protein [Candidatus Nanohaloarchaea archaeon]